MFSLPCLLLATRSNMCLLLHTIPWMAKCHSIQLSSSNPQSITSLSMQEYNILWDLLWSHTNLRQFSSSLSLMPFPECLSIAMRVEIYRYNQTKALLFIIQSTTTNPWRNNKSQENSICDRIVMLARRRTKKGHWWIDLEMQKLMTRSTRFTIMDKHKNTKEILVAIRISWR